MVSVLSCSSDMISHCVLSGKLFRIERRLLWFSSLDMLCFFRVEDEGGRGATIEEGTFMVAKDTSVRVDPL